ncbi:beta-1,6-N-acetylglucosaminyltransferase [Aliiroseovarius sp. F47248L]|uniref:beta-1,6-N-acetylglucosaminyltransferase n=1 Tax=Aliiroseovarius sp. F47248L TaxID=2926420 RepID=UPI001FF2ED1C|nr:beta-1,6-N-acetylglucosaminyltransferase [Aliiroseovarius sp. F47248L]MCK0140214.1 beta-1,6-N-acetylglucosaminyltransferase [Aliiroseovarius sp. F47248L]
MSLGIVMLVHDALDRAEQLVRHWSTHGCPVVVHVDAHVTQEDFSNFTGALSDLSNVRFCRRRHCKWGTWSLVAASQTASEAMLETFPDVQHVLLASGSCLPLRPISEMRSYLNNRPQTDFIESVTTEDVPWTIGGLDIERFTLRFPFSWKRQRRLFDAYVSIQRRLGVKRDIPDGLIPHLGSQWWCLTRATLSAILNDPLRSANDRYFRQVWIPDESYYQTLARRHSSRIESRSLTLSKFDFQGKPHVFYDDHLQLLRRSDCFVARKAWRYAGKLYDSFLSEQPSVMTGAEPNPGKIDRIFTKAIERRTKGRPGLYMPSRFPRPGHEGNMTAARYTVLEGFTELFEGFDEWLTSTVNARVHGHLFAEDKVHFAGGVQDFFGALTDSASLRDYNPKAFLTNLIWNTRGERQCFQYGPRDNQDLSWDIAKDSNARIYVVSGAWAVPLFQSNRNFSDIRGEAARLQRIESEHLTALRSSYARARTQIWSLADFVLNPSEVLQSVVEDIGPQKTGALTSLPKMKPLQGFGQFLQDLKNQGMHPYLMGDFPARHDLVPTTRISRKPYLVK